MSMEYVFMHNGGGLGKHSDGVRRRRLKCRGYPAAVIEGGESAVVADP